MTVSERDVVAALEQELVRRIGEPRYNLWFDRNTRFRWEDDHLLVGVPNHFFQEWLDKTFGEAVRAAASQVFGKPMQVRFSIDPELFQAARRAQAEAALPVAPSDRPTREPAPTSTPPAVEEAAPASPPRTARTRKWRRLIDFVVGPCNRVAHAAALGVVERPGQEGNPLVLHGPAGTGKTHLLEGIYAGLRKSHPAWRVVFLSAEEFTNRFVQAMRLGKLSSFRRHFREADALLVDDLHFLATKRATQEEFIHTLDVLAAEGRPVIVTCDCHPRLADELAPELADRLLGGAVWGLAPPETDTRLAILRAQAARAEPPIPEAVLRFLAEQLRGNVRELEGALHSVRHFSRVAGRPVDLSLAREALGDRLRHAVRVVHLADIDRAVCKVLRLEAGALQARGRAWATSHPRMLAIYLARKHTAASYAEIGQHFGGRNHSTAVAAEKKIRQGLQAGADLVLGERRLRLRDVVELAERELLG